MGEMRRHRAVTFNPGSLPIIVQWAGVSLVRGSANRLLKISKFSQPRFTVYF